LVLFRGATNSGCGYASSQSGPHYCPTDQTIYLDETFFDELQARFGGSNGDVAQAYVLAHEAGHHAQNQLGIMDEVQASGYDNDLSVKLELQADCFAGLWAYSVKDLGVFEEGEIQEAISAAEAVGDDNIQSRTQGQVNPETWTHGSSAQRIDWFNRGFNSGQINSCNTFG
jgi:predicted metalloprotease